MNKENSGKLVSHMKIEEKTIQLSSSKSLQTSLESVRLDLAGLNTKRKGMLERVPNSGDWSKFPKDSLTTKDIAFLSAKTNHEFAILRGKREDILFHGTHYHCEFTDILIDMLMSGKLELFAHSHVDGGNLIASKDDRDFLKAIGQKSSTVVSAYDGHEVEFSTNLFDF